MKTRAEMMKIWRRRWRIKQRNQFYNLGLRSDGLPRLTDRRPMTQCERRRHQRLMRKIRYQRFASRRKAAGLTVRGTRPVYGVRETITRFDIWQDFRSQISVGLVSFEDVAGIGAGFTDERGQIRPVTSERQVFELVGLEYLEPWERS